MPRKAKYDRYVKPVVAKGKLYLYFDTGQRDERGRKVYKALPPLSDKYAYGQTYAALLAGRSRRANVAEVTTITIRKLVHLFQLSQQWRELAPGTQRVYTIYLGRLVDLIGDAPAKEVTASDLVQLMDRMGETPGAANLFIGAVGSLYKWGRKRNHVPIDCRPTVGVDMNKLGEHEPWPEHLVELALASDNANVRLATHLLYFTALRIGDVAALKWSDIRGGTVYVTPAKTRRHGTKLAIRMHDRLAAEIAQTPKRGLTILAGERGGKLSDDAIRKWLQAFAAEHGCEIVPHGLRKNAVNALLECGCSVAETAAISGQTLQLVEHYARQRNTTKLGDAAILKWNKA